MSEAEIEVHIRHPDGRKPSLEFLPADRFSSPVLVGDMIRMAASGLPDAEVRRVRVVERTHALDGTVSLIVQDAPVRPEDSFYRP